MLRLDHWTHRPDGTSSGCVTRNRTPLPGEATGQNATPDLAATQNAEHERVADAGVMQADRWHDRGRLSHDVRLAQWLGFSGYA
jgi:hypothetical protein